MKIDESKLDNPVWNSLTEVHKRFSIEYDGVKFYAPEHCPFGGSINFNKSIIGINKYARLIESFYIVGEKPVINSNLTLSKNLICNQMLLIEPVTVEIDKQIVELQSKKQKSDLHNLVNLVQPGYFKNKTSELGKYFGIYKDSELIAVVGERMQMNEFTEVSAVVTHPIHTGQGYAKQLIKHATDSIFNEDKIPFLHVSETNIGAIKLYEKLGFTTRRKISFWNLKTM